jgi:hypothetical protein
MDVDLLCPTFKPTKHNIFDATLKVVTTHERHMDQFYHLPGLVKVPAAS